MAQGAFSKNICMSIAGYIHAIRKNLPTFFSWPKPNVLVFLTCKWGQAASNVGSSSSGSNSAPEGFEDGGNVRKRLIENCEWRGRN